MEYLLSGCLTLFMVSCLALTASAVYYTTRVNASSVVIPVTASKAAVWAATQTLPKGDARAGEALFAQQGCAECHAFEPEPTAAAPSLSGIAERAANAQAGYSPQAYLYEAILEPPAHTAMPETYSSLKKQELADLIAFLMTK